jgi:hypothetical protein
MKSFKFLNVLRRFRLNDYNCCYSLISLLENRLWRKWLHDFFYFNFFLAFGCSLMCETLKVFRLERGSSSNWLYCAQRLVSVCDRHTSALVNGTKA